MIKIESIILHTIIVPSTYVGLYSMGTWAQESIHEF